MQQLFKTDKDKPDDEVVDLISLSSDGDEAAVHLVLRGAGAAFEGDSDLEVGNELKIVPLGAKGYISTVSDEEELSMPVDELATVTEHEREHAINDVAPDVLQVFSASTDKDDADEVEELMALLFGVLAYAGSRAPAEREQGQDSGASRNAARARLLLRSYDDKYW